MTLTVLVCTHNRAELLERALASLNAARRPAIPVRILVAANACTDDTLARMRDYEAQQAARGSLPLRVIEVPIPGKSHALNSAIREIDTELVALVDDDHRVGDEYLMSIERAAASWPDAGLYCGRILPDWDGTEPTWVHDSGAYRIYPLPIPRYDQGDDPKRITAKEGPIPGGGNLVVRRRVFELTGRFETVLGPHGHDLGGGEDSEFVLRAMARGVTCQYVPDMVQHHYVDNERLKLSYLLKKSYQRTRSTARLLGNGRVPLYMYRKFAEYGFRALFNLSWAKRRFYYVRSAAALGEIRGRRESGYRGVHLDAPHDYQGSKSMVLGILTAGCALLAWLTRTGDYWAGLFPLMLIAGAATTGLVVKSLSDFSQTGPRIRDEIRSHYRRYSLLCVARLAMWAFFIMVFTGGGGVLVYYALNATFGGLWSPWLAAAAAALGILGATALQLVSKLHANPGLLIASMHYRISRLYGLWQWSTAARLNVIRCAMIVGVIALVIAASWKLFSLGRHEEIVALWLTMLSYVGFMAWSTSMPEAHARPLESDKPRRGKPNILLVGSDTLRADRLGALGYRRALTPNIDAFARQGALFTNCYVPCARTAPSLISLLTGTWPRTHRIRDNIVSDAETKLNVASLPQLLKAAGYRTAAISDWCGADLGKFSFGFDFTDIPDDQWNLKYFIRQGPKDLRLFVSLFTHNRLGRLLLPEIYYLGGVPLTSQMGRRARRLISRLAAGGEPFLLNIFYSTTHPPFASEWPWYTRFADPNYRGESKFAMAKLTDPFEIIRRQGAPKEEFDLDQIIDLYDGCVAQFDDEVGRVLHHLDACGLADNTIVVIYSDHGMEFFEHDTWGQGNSAVGDFSARVPLLIYDPRIVGCGRVDHVVRSIDLVPTLLELASLPVPPNMDGVSLAACLSDPDKCPQLNAYNETGIWIANIPGLPEAHVRYPDLLEMMDVPSAESGTLGLKSQYERVILQAKDRMLRRGRWKLVWQPLVNGSVLRLHDLEKDPNCRFDVSDRYPEVTAELWAYLEPFVTADAISFHADVQSAPPARDATAPSKEINARPALGPM